MRWFVAAAVSAAILLFALPALAYKPPSGCWGTCGGDEGPVGGYFYTHKGLVESFGAEFKCLGTQKIPQPVGPPAIVGDTLTGIPNLKVGTHGGFSWHGKAKRYSGSKAIRVQIALDGHFVTSSKARISVSIEYRKCGTQRLTIHRDT